MARKKNDVSKADSRKNSRNSAEDTENKTKKKKKKEESPEENAAREEIREMQQQRKNSRLINDLICGLIFIGIGVLLFIAVQFKQAGEFGNALGDILRGVFGLVGIILPWYLIIFGVLLVIHKASHFSGKSFLACVFMLLMFCVLNSSRFIDTQHLSYPFIQFYQKGVSLEGGGLFGMSIGTLLTNLIGISGLYLFSIIAILICFLLMFNTPLNRAIENFQDRREEKRIMKGRAFVDSSIDPALEAERSRHARPAEGNISAFADGQGADAAAEIPESEGLLNYAETPGADADSAPRSRKPLFGRRRRLLSDNTLSQDAASSFTAGDFPSGDSDVRIVTPYEEPFKRGGLSDIPPSDPVSAEPAFLSDGAGRDASHSNVVDFLNTEDPFMGRRSDGNGSTGLEAPLPHDRGYGLDDRGYGSDASGTLTEAEPDMTENAAASGSEKKKATKKEIAREAAEIGAGLGLAGGTAALTRSSDQNSLDSYHKPPVDLLIRPEIPDARGLNADLKKKARLLEDTLQSFNVDARVVQVTQGPAVTRYEIQPNVGVKVSKISSLADDIALNLRARSIRIEAPIPGKAAVGIEVENDKINMVRLREIIDSREFRNAPSKIEFAVGKDIAGKPIVADLKSMPHLLIAGSTGSGKSVCINSIITSILYKANPDEVKLVLIDPKVVELGNYNGIPHLLIPVVTDPSKAAAALNWAVAEMTNRYKMFADAGVRDLSSYNKKMQSGHLPDQVMPQVVIIIDELADLMMAAPSQVEESICRLAQMARAAGMHLIVATQRPSVDIITGVIKANIPSRIAFAVSSQFDSRTILDTSGAEKLVGKGDMLYNPLGMGKPIRVQGTFVSDEEVERVINYVKDQVKEADYSEEVIDTIENGGGLSLGGSDADELLPDAIEAVVSMDHASVSSLQRRFRIGYNRAARIMDEMEERGIVGPQDGSRPRQVLMTEEELEQLKEDTKEF